MGDPAPDGVEDKARALDLALPRSSPLLRPVRAGIRRLGDLGLRLARGLALLAALAMALGVALGLVEWVPLAVRVLGLLWGSGGDAPLRLAEAASLLLGTMVMLAKVAVFGASGMLALQVATTRDFLPVAHREPGRVGLEGGEARRVDLHGTPGIAVLVGIRPRDAAPPPALELVARLVGGDGEYLPAARRAFEGEVGEVRVRRTLSREQLVAAAGREVGLFLPLAALTSGSLAGDRDLEVELLAFAPEGFQGRALLPLRLPPAPPPAAGGPTEGVRLLEAGGASEARCGVCGEQLGPAPGELACCERCQAPHHLECGRFLGSCSRFGCEGRLGTGAAPAEGASAPGDASPLAPRAELVRLTDPPEAAGDEALPVVTVPRAPRSPWELRPLAVAYAAAILSVPLILGALLLWASPPAALALLALVAGVTWLQPRTLRNLAAVPLALAAPRLARAFPPAGIRDFSANLRLLRAAARTGRAREGGGVRLEGVLLVWGLEHQRLDLVLRLRAGGGYLPAAHAAVRGVFGELRVRWTTEAITRAGPHALRFGLSLRGDAAELPGPPRVRVLGGELLVACRGEVLAEMDLPVPFAPRQPVEEAAEEADEPPVSGGRARAVDPTGAPEGEAERAPCALCKEEPRRQVVTCYTCRHRGHAACWDFLGGCPRCGSSDGIEGEHWGGEHKR